jgi:hypothetical protein
MLRTASKCTIIKHPSILLPEQTKIVRLAEKMIENIHIGKSKANRKSEHRAPLRFGDEKKAKGH